MRLPLLVAALLLAVPSHAAERAANPAAKAQLERLKALAGTWKGPAGEAGAKETFEAVTTFKVTGGGSAVVETLGPGTPHEMITVYHLDGEDLLLTHYCAAGNQPTMRAVPSGAEDAITFDFLRGTNMRLADVHMHAARLRFDGPDRLVGEWTSWKDGKPAGTMRFDLTRQR